MLDVDGITVRYGSVVALDRVSLTVADGKRLAVLGPSGSGKSTLLRAIAGLEPLAAGTIAWDGRDLAGVPVHARRFGLMFQDYVLFPQRDVAHNVSFGLEMAGQSAGTVAARVQEVLALVGLAGYEGRAVSQLSGGEQQRVALARALAPEPRLLMLDEPLGALDRTLRERLLGELVDLFRRLALTIVYVTHDQEEALAVGDRVAVLERGRLAALATPRELWQRPPSEFVARFLGLPNITDALVDSDGRAATEWGPLPVPPGTAPGRWRLLVRPEGLSLAERGEICGTVESATYRGSRSVLSVAIAGAARLEAHLSPSVSVPPVGARVCLAIDRQAVLMLPADEGGSLTA